VILVDANVLIDAIEADSPHHPSARRWLAQPYVRAVSPGEDYWPVLRKLLRDSTAGKLTSDAHLAAMPLELGAGICSTDGDFERFAGVERINPYGRLRAAPPGDLAEWAQW
jgi:predicted nucleic acid-binding protein